jgi:hypothetical protein
MYRPKAHYLPCCLTCCPHTSSRMPSSVLLRQVGWADVIYSCLILSAEVALLVLLTYECCTADMVALIHEMSYAVYCTVAGICGALRFAKFVTPKTMHTQTMAGCDKVMSRLSHITLGVTQLQLTQLSRSRCPALDNQPGILRFAAVCILRGVGTCFVIHSR